MSLYATVTLITALDTRPVLSAVHSIHCDTLYSKAAITWILLSYYLLSFSNLCMQLGTQALSSDTSREVYWILLETCQCALPYGFSVRNGYFACMASDYVIFRAELFTPYDSSHTVDMASLKAKLSNFLTRHSKTQITINGGRYLVGPDPCELTVPQLDSPHCLDSSPTQQASAAVSTSPQDSNVTTIVAIMSASMVLVVLGGCIVYLVIGLRKT